MALERAEAGLENLSARTDSHSFELRPREIYLLEFLTRG